MRLKGRRVLITGGSQGFGLAVARAFVSEGASLMLCARGEDSLIRAQSELQQLAPEGVRVLVQRADVTDLQSVDHVVRRTLDELGGLEVLVCNAGVYGPKGRIGDVKPSDWWESVSINLLGTVLPCHSTIPHFRSVRYGKIIILSGGGATKPMPCLSAYAASKAGVVRLGETLAQEVAEFQVDVNSVAPGALNTRLLDEILDAGAEKVGEALFTQAVRQKESGGTPLEVGASLCVFLASAESDGITGRLISAVWDPWKEFEKYRSELSETDIYTLRRIVPEDRGKRWN